MAAELTLAPEAEQDVAEAYAWYESRRPGLGEEFLSCVDACIEAIRRTPDLYPVVHDNYRRSWCAVFRMSSFTSLLSAR
jgi:hypothetical protein